MLNISIFFYLSWPKNLVGSFILFFVIRRTYVISVSGQVGRQLSMHAKYFVHFCTDWRMQPDWLIHFYFCLSLAKPKLLTPRRRRQSQNYTRHRVSPVVSNCVKSSYLIPNEDVENIGMKLVLNCIWYCALQKMKLDDSVQIHNQELPIYIPPKYLAPFQNFKFPNLSRKLVKFFFSRRTLT